MTQVTVLGYGFTGACDMLFIMTPETTISCVLVPDLTFIGSPSHLHRWPDIVEIDLLYIGPRFHNGLVIF